MDKNILAKTPPMGWNSWDCYGASVTEDILLKNAAFMAKYLKRYGYEYVVCDIQWYEPTARGTRYHDYAPLATDAYSRLIPAENRFPSSVGGKGFSVIAEKIHAMGLKFGIHMMRGIPRQAANSTAPILCDGKTAADVADVSSYCSWNTDMYGINAQADGAYEYYLSVFRQYAEWGVDFVKVDDICVTELFPDNPYSAKVEIELIRRAIDESGRDMVLSLSPGPARVEVAEHLQNHANMWRMTGDFWDNWDKLLKMFDYCKTWYPYVKEGCWPDCDMLPIGRIRIHEDGEHANEYSRFTKAEQETMLSLWCIFRSPLMLGGELTDGNADVMRLITNEEILKMHRESRNARPVADGRVKIWLADGEGETYAAVFNTGKFNRRITLQLGNYGLQAQTAVELWSGKEATIKNSKIKLNVQSHGAAVIKLIKNR